jgi:hypothetical protein
MMTLPFLVVGAGPSGLGFATELAHYGPVVLLDRDPVTGRGQADVQRLGVELRLGESALRWETLSGETLRGETLSRETLSRETLSRETLSRETLSRENGLLMVAGPGRIEPIAGRHLIFAGGLRPATAADLNVTGDRPAGVMAGPVAERLLQAGVRLGETVVVLGDGPCARAVAERARALDTRVVAVTDNGDWGDERFGWPGRLSVIGRARVTHLRLHTARARIDVRCDAVVLAADPRPNRNIAGALTEGAPAVTFHQPLRPYGAAQRYELAMRAARAWLAANGPVANEPATEGPGPDRPGTDRPGTNGPGTNGPGTNGLAAEGPAADRLAANGEERGPCH